MFSGLNISASALTANRLRMDVVSANIANANTTRASYVNGQWVPYKRKIVEIAPKGGQSFDSLLQAAMNKNNQPANGMRVTSIKEDNAPLKRVYDPSHPDADESGYVMLPNVDPLKEMIDLMSVSRSYEANITAFNINKSMMAKALEIGAK